MLFWLENLLLLNFSVFVAFGIYNKTITRTCIVVGLLVYMLLRVIVYKKKVPTHIIEPSFLNKFIGLFLGAVLISLAMSRNVYHSQEIFFQRYGLFFVSFFIALFLSRRERNFKILVCALLCGAVFISVGGVVDIIKFDIPHNQLHNRLLSSFGFPCLFAPYFLYVLPFFACFVIFPSRKLIKILSAVGGIFVGTAFFYHYSRTAWVAFLIAFALTMFIYTRYKTRTILFVLVFLMLFFVLPQFKTRLFSRLTLEPEKWGDRVQLWTSALDIFKKYPLTGAGVGMYEKMIYKSDNGKIFKEGGMFYHHHAHNTYLEVMADMGILGLIFFLLTFIFLLRYLFRYLRKTDNDPYLLSFTVSILAVLIGEITSSTILVGVYSASLFWFLIGMAVGRVSYLEEISKTK